MHVKLEQPYRCVQGQIRLRILHNAFQMTVPEGKRFVRPQRRHQVRSVLCRLVRHSKKNRVAWYWKLRNELRCFSEYLQEPTTRCIAQLVLFFLKCTRYFFQRDTSSESSCNRSFRGQPSGWNRLLVMMCTSTRILYPISTNFKQRAIPQYPLLYGSLSFILWLKGNHF